MTVIQSKVTASEIERLGGSYDPNSVSLIHSESEQEADAGNIQSDVPKAAVERGLRAVFWGCCAFAFAGEPFHI